MSPGSIKPLVFDESTIALFSSLSGDRNAIHMPVDAVPTRLFGHRVVFGALSLLTMLAQTELPLAAPVLLEAAFPLPIRLNHAYTLIHTHDSRYHRVQLRDGSRVHADVCLSTPSNEISAGQLLVQDRCDRLESYDPAVEYLPLLRAALGVYSGALPRNLIAILCWCSYHIGMRAADAQRVFSSVSILLSVGSDESYLNLRSGGSGDVTIATACNSDGQLQALINLTSSAYRPVSTSSVVCAHIPLLRRLDPALVVGGTRGLGAALTATLGHSGLTTIATHRSAQPDSASLKDAAGPHAANVVLLQGDASHEEWCRHAALIVSRAYQCLGALVLNAAPRIEVLGWDPADAGRMCDYVDQSLRLVAHPLANFLPLLREGGVAVLVSSADVVNARKGWLHQSAAKTAAEVLFRDALARYKNVSGIIVRPSRFLSDQTRATRGAGKMVSPHEIAATIVKAIFEADDGQRIRTIDV